MCSTAMISNWRIDYSKYSVSLTDQKKVFFWVGGGHLKCAIKRTSFPRPPPTPSHFLFFSFSLFHLETTTFSVSLYLQFSRLLLCYLLYLVTEIVP